MFDDLFHKIQKYEVNKAAEALTTAFLDYPLFRTMFPTKNEKRYVRKVYGSFLFWLYSLPNSFYTNDDITCVFCVEKPGDKNPNAVLSLLTHPWFLLRGVFYDYSIRDFLMIGRNIDFSDKYAKKYKQDGDYYFHLLCTVGDGRASKTLFNLFAESEGKNAIICETYTEKNVRLYESLGFKVCEKIPWYGLTHYVMRREKNAR